MATTLADLIYEPTRRLTYSVRINGVPLISQDQAAALAELAGVPAVIGFGWDHATAHIDVNRCPSWVRSGMPVTIDCGFDNLMMRCFTGYVVALPGEEPENLRDKVIVRGATVQVGTPPDDVPVELNAIATLVGADIQPPLPDGTHIEHEISIPLVHDADRLAAIANRLITQYGGVARRPSGEPARQTIFCGGELYKATRAYQLDAIDLGGLTDEDAINLICDLVGITKRSLIEPSDGWYLFDVDAEVRRGRAIDMLAQVMQVGGLEAYHTEDGTVVFRQIDFAPGPSHAWQYDVQDQDLARIVSATGEMAVTWNPFVRLYSTGLINIPFLNFNSQRVFVRNVRHEVGPQAALEGGAGTYIDAIGGSRLGGTLQQNPIAAFTFQVEREVIGTELKLVYHCDASSSFDPDGSIASYTWTCNRTTTPTSLPSTKVMTFSVPSSVATPLTLTLQVADNDGNTHSVSIDLPTSSTETAITIPAIFAALKVQMSATPDGGANWNDLAALSGDETSVDAKPADGVNSGIACYGYTDGSIKRTTDFALSSTTVLAASGANGTINEIWWDKLVTTRVWAATSTGRLLRSDDDGVTWAVHKDFGGGYPLYRIATPIPRGVWVFGGRGDQTGTLMQYQDDVGAVGGGGPWVSVAVGGHLAADMAGAGSAVHVRSAAGRIAGELAILLNGAVPGGVNVFYTANVFDPAGAGWQRATGSVVGLTDGREIVPDFAQGTFRVLFGDRNVHSCTNGIAYTAATNVLPAGFTPNRALWLGDFLGGFSGVYLVAAEDAGFTGAIYKSTDALASVAALRPATGFASWPAGAAAKGIAIGAPTTAGARGLFVHRRSSADAQSEARIARLAGTNYVLHASPAADGKPYIGFDYLATTAGKFFFRIQEPANAASAGQLQRSPDCITWENVGPAPSQDANGEWSGAVQVKASSDGTVWMGWGCITQSGAADVSPMRLYKSIDGGANFTMVYENSTRGSLSIMIAPYNILMHPTDPDTVVLLGFLGAAGTDQWIRTHDAGFSFTTVTGAVMDGQFELLSNNRIICSERSGKIAYTDDWGDTALVVAKKLDGVTDATLSGSQGKHPVRGGSNDAYVIASSTSTRVEIWRSVNGGSRWEQICDDNTLSAAVFGVYVREEHALYIGTLSTAATGKLFKLADPLNAVAPVTLEDVSYNLDTLFTVSGDTPTGTDRVGGLAFLP